MERGRKTKIITIVALVVAIVTMSLGFAVFSNVLTISSSATVKPNAEDYIVTIYGAAEEIPDDVLSSGDLSAAVSYFTSKTTSVPFKRGAGDDFYLMPYEAQAAVIDNKNFTISNINVTFSDFDQGVSYGFMIKNEGKKSVYLNFDTIVGGDKTCVAKEGTSQDLVDKSCDNINFGFNFLSLTGASISGVYEMTPNEAVGLLMYLTYDNYTYAPEEIPGEFTVNFDDIQLAFSSVDNSQSS